MDILSKSVKRKRRRSRTPNHFPEMPGDRQTLDDNASKTEPAKLLAVFVLNTDEKELVTPIKK